jgi:protein-tyrosine phosphatase
MAILVICPELWMFLPLPLPVPVPLLQIIDGYLDGKSCYFARKKPSRNPLSLSKQTLMKFNNLLPAIVFTVSCLPAILPAEIVLKTPASDEIITNMAPELRSFLNMSQADRREFFNDKEKRNTLNKLRDAQPYTFTWDCTRGETGTFTVILSEKDDYSEPSPTLVLPPRDKANPNEARLVNFPIGKVFYWKVKCVSEDGKTVTSGTGRFKTDAFPPRLLTIPDVGNIRDQGGRKGLDGRMIRQGMIFRSAGLNNNSPDFSWDRTKWKKEKIADFSIGASKLTPASIDYINNVLHWKTDLDLRSPGEVASMTESPAGPGVRWVHHSSAAYGSIFGKNGSCTGSGPEAMAKNFRLFCDRANYPIDFHCIAGADRTGALAYVLAGVLGVDSDDLVRDWEITANNYFKYEKMFDDLVDGFVRFGAPEDPLHKKIEAYLYKIGITEQEIAAFRSIMLEDPHP